MTDLPGQTEGSKNGRVRVENVAIDAVCAHRQRRSKEGFVGGTGHTQSNRQSSREEDYRETAGGMR